jgi:hypothetical protein
MSETTPGNFALASRRVPHGYVLIAIYLLGVAVKSLLVVKYLPSIRISDEVFFMTTGYDFANWGRSGVPHPAFLYYPPVTSLLIALVYLVGLPASWAYTAVLILFNALLTTTIFAAYLTSKELFQRPSLFLAAFLVFAPPSYVAMTAMSEAPFIVIYSWSLYFFVRMIRRREVTSSLAVGLLLSLLCITRRTGPLAICGPFAALLLESFHPPKGEAKARRLYLYAWSLLPPIPITIFWKWASFKLVGRGPLGLSVTDYWEKALLPSLSAVRELLSFAQKFAAQISFVWLTTLGVCLPVVIWFALRRAKGEPERILRAFIWSLLAFMVLASLAAAAHMYLGSGRHPTLPRYMLFGRYAEYFSIPLFLLALGLYRKVATQFRAAEKLGLVVMTSALALILIWVVPPAFYQNAAAGRIAPNSLGLALMITAVEGTGPWLRFLIAGGIVGSVALLTTRLFFQNTAVKAAAILAATSLVLANFALALAASSEQSVQQARESSDLSDFVTSHSSQLGDGVYFDMRRRNVYRRHYFVGYKLYVEHIDRLIAGDNPEEYVGQMPVVTKDVYPGWEVLFKERKSGYKVYRRSRAHVKPEQSAAVVSGLVAGDLDGDGRADLARFDRDGRVFYTLDLNEWTIVEGTSGRSLTTLDVDGNPGEELAGVSLEGELWYLKDLSTRRAIGGAPALSQVAACRLSAGDRLGIAALSPAGEVWHTKDLESWRRLGRGTVLGITCLESGDAHPDELVTLDSKGRVFKGVENGVLISRRGEFTELIQADFDGDGREDLAAVASSGRMHLSLDRLNWQPTMVVAVPTKGGASKFAGGDFDGDGRAEIATVLADGTVWISSLPTH